MVEGKDLMQRYERSAVIRALMQLIPHGVGSAIDVYLMQSLENTRRERIITFFDELEKGDVLVDEALLESEDFIHCYVHTIRLALNTRRREKIRTFARYLKNSLHEPRPTDIDEYEEFLGILDDLSYRELQALDILDEFSDRPRERNMNDLEWTNSFWGEFESRLCDRLSIPRAEIVPFMNRLARTGCYEMITGTFLDYSGGRGLLTPIYGRLAEYIKEREERDAQQT